MAPSTQRRRPNNTTNNTRGSSTPRRRGNRQSHLSFAPPPAENDAVPAMSSGPERAFSAAKITLSDRRNKLGMQMFEQLECLKSWTSQIEWELEVRDMELASNALLKGPAIEEAIRDKTEADL